MNKLPLTKRIQIIQLLIEGISLREISRIADVSVNTVTKLLIDVGKACQDFHDVMVVGVSSQRVQCNEIRSFIYAKEGNVEKAPVTSDGAGDVWTWTGLDVNTKLIISWYMGNRDARSACELIQDVKSRISNRMQLTTDEGYAYLEAINEKFTSDIDFIQLTNIYGNIEGTDNANGGAAEFKGIIQKPVMAIHDEKYVSIPYVERQNLAVHTHMRRFTRLTSTFSKKIENHSYAIALHFVYYNFCTVHKTLQATPAMEAGLVKRLMEIGEIAELAPNGAPRDRGGLRKNISN